MVARIGIFSYGWALVYPIHYSDNTFTVGVSPVKSWSLRDPLPECCVGRMIIVLAKGRDSLLLIPKVNTNVIF